MEAVDTDTPNSPQAVADSRKVGHTEALDTVDGGHVGMLEHTQPCHQEVHTCLLGACRTG